MMAPPRFISSEEVLALLGRRQLIDQNTCRVVIDIQAGQEPMIYTQSYGDENLFVELITDLQVTNDPHIPVVAPVDYFTPTATSPEVPHPSGDRPDGLYTTPDTTEAKDQSTNEH